MTNNDVQVVDAQEKREFYDGDVKAYTFKVMVNKEKTYDLRFEVVDGERLCLKNPVTVEEPEHDIAGFNTYTYLAVKAATDLLRDAEIPFGVVNPIQAMNQSYEVSTVSEV